MRKQMRSSHSWKPYLTLAAVQYIGVVGYLLISGKANLRRNPGSAENAGHCGDSRITKEKNLVLFGGAGCFNIGFVYLLLTWLFSQWGKTKSANFFQAYFIL